MSTPIQPVPDIVLAPEFPTLADRPAGTYNTKAAAWANGENAMAQSVREVALTAENNATVAQERAQIALDAATTATAAEQVAVNSAASAASDASKTAADRQAVESALLDGPVISVMGRSGIVTGLVEADVAEFTGSITEAVYALSGTTPAINPANGTIQTWVLSGESSPTESFESGQSLLLEIDSAGYGITWPTVEWKTDGGTAPALSAGQITPIVLWKVGPTLRGARVGDA